MIELLAFWGKIAAGVIMAAVGLAAAWPWIKGKFGGSIPAGTSTAIDTAADYADEAVAGGALGTAALLFKKHGDTEAVAQLGGLWGKAMAWPGEVHAAPAPTQTPPAGAK